MECYHGVIVLDALAEGRVNGRPRSAGRFYLEKDWGSSFPKAWIWMQSNYFGGRPASLTCSVARVPFRGREFTGFIAGLLAGGVLFRFATYNGARLEQASASAGTAEVILRRADLSLRLRATRRAGAELASPVNGEMRGRIVESLRSEVDVRLTRAGRTLFEGIGTCAGLEVVRPEELSRAEVRLPA
jgi:tocopherol cyclase